MAQYWDDYVGDTAWKQAVDAQITSKLTPDEKTLIDLFIESWYYNMGTKDSPNYYDPQEEITKWESFNEGQRLTLVIQAYNEYAAGSLDVWHWLPMTINIWFSVGIPNGHGGQSGQQGQAREADFMAQIAKQLLPIFQHPGTHVAPKPVTPQPTGQGANPDPATPQVAQSVAPASGSGGLWLLVLLALATMGKK